MGGHQGKSHSKGHSLRDQLTRAGIHDLVPGAVLRVKDRNLSFPHNLLKRKVHESRFALLLSNESICASKAHPIVVVAPMTHDVSIRLETDVLVTRHRENGLLSDSLVQLHLIQPLLKTDVVSREGTLSAADWDLVLETLVWMTDRA